MSNHLPECEMAEPICSGNVGGHRGFMFCLHCHRRCICDRLRACEQRVRNQDIATHHADLQEAKALLASRDEAWYAGVDAAREAVEGLPAPYKVRGDFDTYGPYNEGRMDMKHSALAAIDALREENL